MNQEQEKLQKMAYLKNDGQLILLNEIEDAKNALETKIDEVSRETQNSISEIAKKIDSIEIPEQKDESENFKALMEKIDEPITVELVIT